MGTQKIEKMRGAADGRGFAATHATETKIMQFVQQERRIAGAHQRFTNGLFYCAAKRCHGDRIPDLKQSRLRPISEPIKLRIGIFNGDDGVLRANHRAFSHTLDAQWKDASVLCVEILPAGIIETLRVAAEVFVGEFSSLLDVFGSENFAGKIRF